jgi:hypothetical protein
MAPGMQSRRMQLNFSFPKLCRNVRDAVLCGETCTTARVDGSVGATSASLSVTAPWASLATQTR